MRLFHKLLIAMFLTTAVVLVVYAVISRITIGGGFKTFLYQQELARVRDELPSVLALYDADGGWGSVVRDPRRFYDIFAPEFDERTLEDGRADRRRPPPAGPRARDRQRSRPGPGERGSPRERGGRRPPSREDGLARRLSLLNAERKSIAGRPASADAEALPVELDGVTVGWVQLIPTTGPMNREQRDFLERQRSVLLITLFSAIAAAGLLAWLLSRQLSAPVARVGQAIRALAEGRFATEVAVEGRDEIADLAKDVNQLARTLAANESARQRWTADIAHELRTPLAILQAELEAISDGVRKPTNEAIESLLSESRHLRDLVNDLHQLSMADAGALDYRMSPLDLTEQIYAAESRFGERMSRAQLTLNIRVPASPVMMQGDATRVTQLIDNLLENSARYTDQGGRVEVALTADGDLTIEDSAPSVSGDQYDQLFDRFYRVEGSRRRSEGGSGLGLAICKKIVEAHNGDITATPSALGGLRVEVSFPVEVA